MDSERGVAVGIAGPDDGRPDVFGGGVQAAVADRGAFHDGVDGKHGSRHLHDGKQAHAQLGPIRAVKRISSVERDAGSGQIADVARPAEEARRVCQGMF